MDDKKYDLFTNMVQNQNFSYDDLIAAGLNSNNTELKDINTYKNSEKVQEIFKNDSGQFDEQKFNNFYNLAASFYNQMSSADYNSSVVKSAVYHRDNIFAPAEQRQKGPQFQTYETINPWHSTEGLVELGKISESPLSLSELAQNYKVLLNPVEAEKNPSKAQWGAAPNDNFMGYFFDTLVLATYDQDVQEKDPVTGQVIVHHKGEPKLSPEGEFYYERLDGRDVYGRQVLNKMNILTKDGSAMNRFDIFDSDDKKGDWFKTTLKNTALVGAMFLPYIGPVFRAASVGTQAVGLLAVLGKIAGGSDNSLFNNMEGWSQSVNRQTAKSEEAQQNVWCLENMINLIGDSVAQLAEQRWIFTAGSKMIAGADIMTEAGQLKKKSQFLDQILANNKLKIDNLLKDPKNLGKAMEASAILNKHAGIEAANQLQNLIKSSQKLSGAISKAYMTGITIKDMYGEAKNAGASDNDAALLTIGYAAAEYALLSTGLGEIVLPELRAGRYRIEAINKALFQKKNDALKSIAKQFGSTTTEQAKRAYVQKMIQFGKDIVSGARVTGAKTEVAKATFAAALGEATEETTEEILADFMRSCHNITQWLQGKNDYMKAFGYDSSTGKFDIDDISARYGMSFIGGFIGGGVANAAMNYKQIHQAISYTPETAIHELVGMIRNNEIGEYKKYTDKQLLGDPNLSATNYDVVDGNIIWQQGTKEDNQNVAAHKALNKQLEIVQGILNANGAQSNSEFLDTNTLNDFRFVALHESTTAGAYLQHYNQLNVDLVKAVSELETLVNSKMDTNNDGVVEDKEKRNARDNKNDSPTSERIDEQISQKKKQIDDIKQELQDLQEGKYAYKFIAQSLFEMTTALSGNFTSPIFAIYAERKYHKKYDKLTDDEKQQALEEWKNFNNLDGSIRFQELTDMYLDIAKNASNVIKQHSEKYLTEDNTFKGYDAYLSRIFNFNTENEDEWIDKLSRALADPHETNQIGQALNNIFFSDELFNKLKEIKERYNLTEPTVADPKKPTADEQLQIEAYQNAYNQMKEEMQNTYDQYLVQNLSSIFQKYIDRGYASQTTKDSLIKIGAYTLSLFNEGDMDYFGFLDLYDKITKLNRTPFEENLDQFAISVGQKAINLTGLINNLQRTLNQNKNSIENFQISNELYKELNNAIKLITLYKAAIEGAQTDNANLGNLFGFNATLNEVAKKVGDTEYEGLAEIDDKTAQILLQDLETNYQRLLTIKQLYLYNRGQKLQLQDRVAINFNCMLFNKMRYIISILDKEKFKDWDKLDILKNAIENSDLHKKAIEDNLKTLTIEQEKQYTKEQIDIENAIYEVFNSNIDKIQDFIEELDIFNIKENLLTEETDSITDKQFIWFLTSRTAVKSEEFYSLYKNCLNADSEKPVAPLVTQELGIYNQFANIINCNVYTRFREATNNAIINKFNKLSEDDKKKVLGDNYGIYSKSKNFGGNKLLGTLLNLTKFDGFALVEGAAGTGKTKAIDYITVQMLKSYSSEQKNPLSHVAVIHGGSKASAIDLQKSINIEKSEAFGKEEFMKIMNPNWKELEWDEKTKSFKIDSSKYAINSQGLFVSTEQAAASSNPFSLIIIDEVQQFSTFDMDIIMDYARKNNISVVVSGDFDQQGVEAKIPLDNSAVFNIGLSEQEFIHSPKLGVIMRTDNELKSQNTIGFQAFMNNENLQKNALELGYYEDDNGLWGDKIIKHQNNEISEDDKKEIDKFFSYLKDDEKVGFIYDDETSELYKLLQTEKYKNKVDFKQGSSALGLEARYYIIETDSNSKSKYLKNIYTGITRSVQGSLLFIKQSHSFNTGNIEIINKKSNELIQEPLPISQIKKYITKRKGILDELLNNVETPKLIPRKPNQQNNQQQANQQQTRQYNFSTGSVLGQNSNYNNVDVSNLTEFTDAEQQSLFGELWNQTKISDSNIESFTFVGNLGNGEQRGQAKVIYYNGDYYLATSEGTAKWNKDTNFWTFAKNNSTTNKEAISILKQLNDSNSVFRNKVIAVDFSALDKSSSFNFISYVNSFTTGEYRDESGYTQTVQPTSTNYTTDELNNRFGDLFSSNQLLLFEFDEVGKIGNTPIIKLNNDYYVVGNTDQLVFKYNKNSGLWEIVDNNRAISDNLLKLLQDLNSLDSNIGINNAVDFDNLTDPGKSKFNGFIQNLNTNKTYSENDIIQIINNLKPDENQLLEDEISGYDVKEKQQQIDDDNDNRMQPTIQIQNNGQSTNFNSLLFSFNTFELGVQLDQGGNPLEDESTPYRIDGYNGLKKLNPNISVKQAIEVIKQMRELLLSTQDQRSIENMAKLIIGDYFGENSDIYVRFAFKFSAILSKGKQFASKGENLIYEKGVNERSIYNNNNQGSRSGEVNRHTIVAIIGDRKSNNIVEIPLLALTSPFTLAYQKDNNNQYIFGDIANEIDQLRPTHSIHEISEAIVKKFGNIELYKSLIDLFRLFNVGSNTIVYLNYQNNSYMPQLTSLGPQVSVKRGDYSLSEGFEFDANNSASEKDISTIISESPFNFTSTPITLIKDVPGLPVKKGSPIILFSDSSLYSTDSKIIDRFIEEQNNSSLPRHINYFYVDPPKYDIKEYFSNKYNIINNNSYIPQLGNPLTTFNILDKIFSNQDCLNRFKNYINDGIDFEKIKNLYNQVKSITTIKDRVGYLLGVDPDEKNSRISVIDRIIINKFRSTINNEQNQNIDVLCKICQDAGVSEVYVHTTLQKSSEYNGFAKINSSNYQYGGKSFTARVKIDQSSFTSDVSGMVNHILGQLIYNEESGQYWSKYDQSYKKHECSIQVEANQNVQVTLEYIWKNPDAVAKNDQQLQQAINILRDYYRATGQYIAFVKNIGGKYELYNFGKIHDIKQINVVPAQYFNGDIKLHKFDGNSVFKAKDEFGQDVYVLAGVLGNKSRTVLVKPNISNNEDQDIFDLDSIYKLDDKIGEDIAKHTPYSDIIDSISQYDEAMKDYYNNTDIQQPENQQAQEYTQEQFDQDKQSLLRLFDIENVRAELNKLNYYKEDFEEDINSIDALKQFLYPDSSVDLTDLFKILENNGISNEFINRLKDIDGVCS